MGNLFSTLFCVIERYFCIRGGGRSTILCSAFLQQAPYIQTRQDLKVSATDIRSSEPPHEPSCRQALIHTVLARKLG